MKQRIFYLDIIRVLACIMVICMHAPMPYSGEASTSIRAFMAYSTYLTLPGVCLFFAVSGVLLLKQKIEPYESGKWLKKRLKKVIIPTLIWTLFYLAVNIFTTDETFSDILRQVCSIPFNKQGAGVLWFMYTLIGLYLITPVINHWIQHCGRKTLQFFLCLWVVTLCYPILTAFVEINESPYGILYYFSGFVGYYCLGYYLHTYGMKGSVKWWIVLLICLMPLLIIFKLFFYNKYDFGFENMYYLGFVCMLMLLCWWKICANLSFVIEGRNKVESFITKISNLSFGIYLMHIFVMRNCVWKATVFIPNYYIQTVVTIIATFIISIVASHLISLSPFGHYIIGYKYRM